MWDTIYTMTWWVFVALLVAGGLYVLLVLALAVLHRSASSQVHKYDDGGYYFDEKLGISEAHAGAHIGLYFKWCLLRGLVDEAEHISIGGDDVSSLDAVRNGDMTATDYLWDAATCKFADSDLTGDGNAFTRWYYHHLYFADLESVVKKPLRSFAESDRGL